MERHHICRDSLPWAKDATRAQGTILIRIQNEDARTVAGQHALWMMTNLAARLDETVAVVVVDAPHVPVLSPAVAPFAEPRDSLADAVIAAARTIGRGVRVEKFVGQICDVFLEYGGSSVDANTICVSANGWIGAVSRKGRRLPSSGDGNPVGAYVAACLAIGEAFKVLARADEERAERAEDLAVNLWDLSTTGVVDAQFDPARNPPWSGVSIGDVHVAGSGAVGNAVHHVWMALPNLSGVSVPVDRNDKPLKDTNLNRYVLTVREDVGRDKARVLEERLRGQVGLRVFPRTRGWNSLRAEPGCELDVADADARRIADAERRGRILTVLNCVDRNRDRADVQDSFPRDLFQGSTLELRAQCSRFDLSLDENACTKCFAPPEDEIEVDDAMAERLEQMDAEQRGAYARARGISPEKLEEWFRQRCGTLTAEQLRGLRAPREEVAEFSVGFVSMMAGLLVAAEHLKSLLGAPTLKGRSFVVRYYFHWNGFRTSELLRDVRCECTTTTFRHTWHRKWGGS